MLKRYGKKLNPQYPEHSYLIKKRIKAYGIKQYKQALIIPIYNEYDQIISLQRIFPNNEKRFFKDGKTKGGFFPIGDTKNSETIYIGEGYATMATIHEITGMPCVVAFNSGNLKSVVKIIKKQNQDKEIIITADNDIKTQEETGKNTGIEAAKEAARVINAKVCICPKNSDFNDLFLEQGNEAVKKALEKIIKLDTDNWENTISLKNQHTIYLDQNIIPGTIGEMAKAVSESTETPIELAFGLILSVIATACHGKFIVKVKTGYKEPVNIWVVIALNPVNRKSAVLMKVTSPVYQWEKSKKKELEPVIKDGEIKFKNKQATLKSLRGQLGKANPEKRNEVENEILEIESNLIEISKYPKIWAQDVTTEHLEGPF